MNVYIGTSGWRYFWNEGGTIEWYIENTGLNAIELNASFYRFPFKNMVSGWAKKGRSLKWCVKVSRQITHIHLFGNNSIEIFKRFKELFEPMEDIISFYLFQLPPKMKSEYKNKIEDFLKNSGLKEKIALEVRNVDWFREENYRWAMDNNITWVSIDAPKLPNEIIKTTDDIYVRFHGREGWYEHNYTKKELEDVKNRIVEKSPDNTYIFFNNDKDMLENAIQMKKIFS
uniref:DUF72 domain-containing protein n=1 Tax=candidate division WOR-3 bacterium TaxID=2052148 RepID=A0A7C4UFY7_UNCW3